MAFTAESIEIPFQEIRQRCEAELPAIAFSILQTVAATMRQRIHTRGLASDNSRIGDYISQGHIRRRQQLGRQVTTKDLFLFGNLSRSLVVGLNGGLYVLGFSTDRARLIAEGQQQQTGKNIYGTTPEERALITRLAGELIARCL